MAGILVIHGQAGLRQLVVDAARRTGRSVVSALDVPQARIATKLAQGDHALVVIGPQRGQRTSDLIDEPRRTWPAHLDVRVIAATNRCLRSEIKRRRFREDLYCRLSVISLHLPPLRERRAMIRPLTQFHARGTAQKLGLRAPEVSTEALHVLMQYDWLGNIRELQNALEYAIVRQSSGTITPDDLPDAVQGVAPPATLMDEIDPAAADLVTILRRNRGNHTQAAAALGVSRTTLWRHLKRRDSGPRMSAVG